MGLEAASRLSSHYYLELGEYIRRNNRYLRTVENKRLSDRRKALARRYVRCSEHILCKWIRKVANEREERVEAHEGDREACNVDLNKIQLRRTHPKS